MTMCVVLGNKSLQNPCFRSLTALIAYIKHQLEDLRASLIMTHSEFASRKRSQAISVICLESLTKLT